MPVSVRPFGVDDLPAAWELARVAFGIDHDPPPGWLTDRPGRRNYGAFDDGGRLVAKALDREQGHWFGGRLVPACGIAGVAVVPEMRGAGLARRVLTALLHGARERGAAVVTLFRTSPVTYRALGCEEVTSLRWTSLPTRALTRVPRPVGVTLRPAVAADVPAVHAAYADLARAGTALMERSGPFFDLTPDAVLGGHDGLTVAEGPDGVEGYASWDRGPGYDAGGRLSVSDLIARTPAAAGALLHMLGTWSDVAPTLHLRLLPQDPATLLAPFVHASVHREEPFMLRVLDARAAVAARGWPVAVDGAVDLHVVDDVCPWNAGNHRLTVTGGVGRLEPGGSESTRLTPRGLALLYAGAADPDTVRRAGLMSGGDERGDAFLRAVTAGPAPGILDYF